MPTDNGYYIEACNQHDYYIQTLHRLARYHAYEKLRKYKEDEASSLMDNMELD